MEKKKSQQKTPEEIVEIRMDENYVIPLNDIENLFNIIGNVKI